jgi:8-amino-7-oxononanoate synthase
VDKQSNKYQFIHDALAERKKNNQFRSTKALVPSLDSMNIEREGKSLINFSSNDYLGLSKHPKVIEKAQEYLQRFGAGSGASRLVTGTLSIHEQLEEKLAQTFGTEAALLFNSGFQANTSIIPALVDRNSCIFIDKKCHNSLIQGSILSRATIKRFRHNNLDHLKNLLEQSESENFNRKVIVSETVFSMDGNRSPVDSLADMATQFKALFYSDDAHALGVLGDQGLGLNYKQSGIDISLGTFGKAFGGFGAFAGCTKVMREYLINHSGGFIYTTALPPAIIGALDAALDLIPEMESERAKLHQKISSFKEIIQDAGFEIGETDSQIIPIIIGDEDETMKLSNHLSDNGLWVSAIRPPTVENGASRIRITFTTMHSDSDIERLVDALKRWKQ